MKKILISVLFLGLVIAQDGGKTGMSFLKNGTGARNIAMGDLGVAGNKDVTSIFYNPANMVIEPKYQIFAAHNEWIQDVKTEIIAASFVLWGIPLAAGINTTSIPGIEVRERPGDPTAEFKAQYFSGSISSGFSPFENLYLGASLKYLYEGMYSDDASGMAFDIGAAYTGLMENLELGFAVRNMGSMNNLRDEKTVLPTDIRFGAAYSKEIESINSNISLVGGIQKYTKLEDIHFHAGTEILWAQLLALRIGYASGYKAKDISFGIGINWNSVNFDYANTPFTENFGSGHTISLMYTF